MSCPADDGAIPADDAQMSEEAPPDDVRELNDSEAEGFTFRQWEPSGESWDDYIRALERAYAQYVDRRRRSIVTEQTPPAPDADDPRS
jgi:hypothetical protein